MQELVKFILDRLLALWPIARVESWQSALLMRGGIIKRDLMPGLHWVWPVLDQVKRSARTECAIDLSAATVETSDAVVYTVSANVSYRLLSLSANWLAVYNLDASLARVARGRLASFIATVTAGDLNGGRQGIERRLLDDLATELRSWGIEITRVHLTDCVRSRAVRLYHDGIPEKA